MYSSYDYSTTAMAGAIGIFIIVFLVVLAIILIPTVIFGILYFKKLGKKGWESIIPIYNTYCLVEVAGLEKYWFYVTLAPFVGVILSFIPIIGSIITMLSSAISILAAIAIYYNINKRLGKDTVWTVLALIIPLVYEIMVVVDKNTVFNANIEVNPDGPFEDLAKSVKNMLGKSSNNTTNQQTANPVNNGVAQQNQTTTGEQVANQPTDNTNNQ